jgi:N4-gp56 family major capsid protein
VVDAFTSTTAVSNLVKTAYDRYVEFALRSQPLVRSIADKHPVQQAMPGSSVVLSLYSDMTPVSAALSETVDPDAVAIANPTQVTVTPLEYGNVTKTTRLAELFAFSEIDPAVLNQVAWNMVDSLEGLALNTLRQGTNVLYGGARSSTGTLTNTDLLTAHNVRQVVAKLRGANVIPRRDSLYWCGIHPDVSVDLRETVGSGGWRFPHEYGANQNIWNGEVGAFEGAYFVESNRMYVATDGATSAKVHRTLFAGQQALAEAVVQEPHLVIGPVLDKLNRFKHVGWTGTLGWAVYRQAALYRFETGTSL